MSKIGIDSYTLSSLLVEDKYFEHSPFLANSLQQFMLWLSTSADVLNGKFGPFQVSFMIQCSDALMFCQQISCDPDFASITTDGKFDVIHSSNLMDHTSPPGLVLTAAPLLKQNAFLFTTVLLYRYVALNGNKYLQAMFGFEPELLPLICGLRCIGCDGPFSDPVLLKPMPMTQNHLLFHFSRNCIKRLVWQKVTNTPYMFPPPSKSSVFAKALCNAALLIPKFKPRPGITTERHLCTESVICIIKSFASQMCSEACANDFQFWEGVSALLRENPSLQNHLLHLQTQAHLNGLHIHLFEEHCAVCSDSPVSQYSIAIKLACVSHESVFNILIHQEDIFDAAQLHHIVDSASGKVVGKKLILTFFFPQKFAEMGFHATVCCVRVPQLLHGCGSTTIMSGKLKDFTARNQSYIFQARASTVSYQSPNFVLKEHCGDATRFKTTLSVSSDLASESDLKISTNHPVLSIIEICCGKETATINFPYPVEYQKAKLKFSSSQRIIELSVPRKEYHFYNEDILPFRATVGHKLTFPPFEFDPEKYSIIVQWQCTKLERSILKARDETKATLLLYVKNLLEHMFANNIECKIIVLTSPAKGIFAYIVIHNIVKDLQNMAPVLDLSFHILDNQTSATCKERWREMVRDMPERGRLDTHDDAVDLMCKVLNYFARHTLKPKMPTNTGPLSKHKLDQYFTRAAVYLLHRDPDAVVEDNNEEIQKQLSSNLDLFATICNTSVSKSPTTIGSASPVKVAADSCAACGMKSMALKKCGSCMKVAYCSKSCQKKDWNKHKRDCTFVPKKRL